MTRPGSDATGWDLHSDGTISPCAPFPWDRPAPAPTLLARGIHSETGGCAMILTIHGGAGTDAVAAAIRRRWPDACIMRGMDILSPKPGPRTLQAKGTGA